MIRWKQEKVVRQLTSERMYCRGGRWDWEGRKGLLHMYEHACLHAVRTQTLFLPALVADGTE